MKGIIRVLLKELELTKSEVSFLFVDNSQITLINRQYLGRDNPTDVISFPQDYGTKRINPEKFSLGDVVISVERAKEQAKKYSKPLLEELKLLIVHGILHLIGYDDIETTAKDKMRKMEKKLLSRLKGL